MIAFVSPPLPCIAHVFWLYACCLGSAYFHAGPPPPPTKLKIKKRERHCITLGWSAPEQQDRSALVEGYIIEHAEGPSFRHYVDTLASLPADLIKDRKMEAGEMLVAWQTKTSFTLGIDLAKALSRGKQYTFRLRSVNRMGISDYSEPSEATPGLCADAKQIAEEEEAEAMEAAAKGVGVKEKKKLGDREEAAELAATDELQPRESPSREGVTIQWNRALRYSAKNTTHASADDEMKHLMKLAQGCTPRSLRAASSQHALSSTPSPSPMYVEPFTYDRFDCPALCADCLFDFNSSSKFIYFYGLLMGRYQIHMPDSLAADALAREKAEAAEADVTELPDMEFSYSDHDAYNRAPKPSAYSEALNEELERPPRGSEQPPATSFNIPKLILRGLLLDTLVVDCDRRPSYHAPLFALITVMVEVAQRPDGVDLLKSMPLFPIARNKRALDSTHGLKFDQGQAWTFFKEAFGAAEKLQRVLGIAAKEAPARMLKDAAAAFPAAADSAALTVGVGKEEETDGKGAQGKAAAKAEEEEEREHAKAELLKELEAMVPLVEIPVMLHRADVPPMNIVPSNNCASQFDLDVDVRSSFSSFFGFGESSVDVKLDLQTRPK